MVSGALYQPYSHVQLCPTHSQAQQSTQQTASTEAAIQTLQACHEHLMCWWWLGLNMQQQWQKGAIVPAGQMPAATALWHDLDTAKQRAVTDIVLLFLETQM